MDRHHNGSIPPRYGFQFESLSHNAQDDTGYNAQDDTGYNAQNNAAFAQNNAAFAQANTAQPSGGTERPFTGKGPALYPGMTFAKDLDHFPVLRFMKPSYIANCSTIMVNGQNVKMDTKKICSYCLMPWSAHQPDRTLPLNDQFVRDQPTAHKLMRCNHPVCGWCGTSHLNKLCCSVWVTRKKYGDYFPWPNTVHPPSYVNIKPTIEQQKLLFADGWVDNEAGDFNFTDKANDLWQLESDMLNSTVFAEPDYEQRRLEHYGNNAHKLKEQRYRSPPNRDNNQRGGRFDKHMGSNRPYNACSTMYNSSPMGIYNSVPSRASTPYNYSSQPSSRPSSPFQRNVAAGYAPTMPPPMAPQMPQMVFNFNTGSEPTGLGRNFSMAPPSPYDREIVRPDARFSDRDDRASNRTRYDSHEDSRRNASRQPSAYRRERSYDRDASPSPPRRKASQTRRSSRHTYASPSPPRRGRSPARRSSHVRGASSARSRTATARGHHHEDEFTPSRSDNGHFMERSSSYGDSPSLNAALRVVMGHADEMISRNGRLSRRDRLRVNDSASPAPFKGALVSRMTRDGQPLAPSVLGKRPADDDNIDFDEPAPKRNASQKQRAKAAGESKPQEGYGGGGYTG